MNGEHMAAEMAEQPSVLERLFSTPRGSGSICARAVARASLRHGPARPRIVRHRRAVRAIPVRDGERRPVALASPSLHTLYRIPADHRGYLAIGISQSGRTPEVVSVLERMRDSGARTVAIVNDAPSPLGDVADVVIDLGREANSQSPQPRRSPQR